MYLTQTQELVLSILENRKTTISQPQLSYLIDTIIRKHKITAQSELDILQHFKTEVAVPFATYLRYLPMSFVVSIYKTSVACNTMQLFSLDTPL